MIKLYTDKISDLHAHTVYSDGNISIRGSIERRISMINQIEEIGISDHFRYIEGAPWKEYRNEIEKCKSIFNRDTRKILLGVEVLASDVEKLSEEHYGDLDYIIIEHFEDFYTLDDYISLISSTKQYFNGLIILAHPRIDKILENLGEIQFIKLLKFLKVKGIPLEINVNWGYWFQDQCDVEKVFYTETREMILLNQEEALVSIGTDSHMYEDLLYDNFERVMWFLSEPE